MFNPEIRKFYDESIGGDALKGAGTGAAIGSVIPGVGTLIGAGAGALIGGISGFFQKKKANKLLKENPYPNEPIPQEELANQQQAERMADEGTPSAQYQQAQKNIQRQQAAAISAAQDRRSGVNAIAPIQEATNNAQGNLDAQSAATRRENQMILQNVNNQVAGYRSKTFDWNQKNKYLQTYQYANSLLGQGNANMFAGADKLLGGVVGAYGQGLFSGGNRQPIDRSQAASYEQGGTGLQTTGGSGYQPGTNTDVILDPNAYSKGALI
jgi:hypothetical protein